MLLEIKGRVRLDAFEKFVRELPNSRSRAVMVLFLHVYLCHYFHCLYPDSFRSHPLLAIITSMESCLLG